MGVWKKTQCTLCGVSCGLEVEVEGTKVVSVRPDKDSPRSHGYACRKGGKDKADGGDPAGIIGSGGHRIFLLPGF